MSAPVHTLQDVMAQALLMERAASERYAEFADALEAHHNREVAQLFRTMAGYEAKHAAEIMAQMGWTDATVPLITEPNWPGFEAPETVPLEQVHYLMQPRHALNLALAAEQRAHAFFGQLAQATTNETVRRAALGLQREEQEHVQLVQAWIRKVPEPEQNWSDDPDPPQHTD